MNGRKYFLLMFVLFLAATPLHAGSEEKADAIVAYTEALYAEPFDIDALQDPVAEALNEGISQKQLTTFIAANIQAGVEIGELVFYLENILSYHEYNSRGHRQGCDRGEDAYITYDE